MMEQVVVESDQPEATLELVETFRLQVGGRMQDYGLVRSSSRPEPRTRGDAAADDGDEADDPGDAGSDPDLHEESLAELARALEDEDEDSDLRAYRLEADGLAGLDPGEETRLVEQALLALQELALEEELAQTEHADDPRLLPN